jgi:WD40 repeat protein
LYLIYLKLGRVIASGGEDSIINFHNSNLEYISCIEDPDFKGATITSLAFNNNSNYLAYATNLGHLKIWDLKTSSTQLNHKFFNNYITSMCFNQDSTFLTIGTVGGNIFNFNVLTFTISNFKYQSYFKLNYLKYSPLIPNLLAACFDDGFIRVFDMTSGEIIYNFGGYHQGSVTGVSFSPINKVFLCSAGSDTRINFFDISAKKHIKTLTTDAPLTSICFNSDGQTIAVGNISGNIILYDLRICTAPKAIFKGHSSSINYIEFSKKPLNNLKPNSSNNLAASNNKANESLNNNSMRSNRSLASIDSNIPYNLQPNAVNTQKLTENKATSLSELKINAILNQAPPKINNDTN